MLAPQSSLNKSWSAQLAEASRPGELARSLGWPEGLATQLEQEDFGFRVRATRYYLSLVNPEDHNDPILRQILPNNSEGQRPPDGYRLDAVGDTDEAHALAPGLIKKYEGRGLLVTTGACAVNCRFCFRRNYPYKKINEGGARLAAALNEVAKDESISELILSGGDPLSLPNATLQKLFERIDSIPHVKRVRIHSRMPVVLPDRIDDGLLQVMRSTPNLRVWFVTHFNCVAEVTEAAQAACQRLLDTGIPVLNQSVLLRGVNDTAQEQKLLLEALVDAGIKPYYLHQLDKVSGTAHFEVQEREGRQMIEELRGMVTGLAMPVWVRDEPGEKSKTPLSS
jgi:EF-P beta-lysylation protein EpmB